jgi:hypothetical protein
MGYTAVALTCAGWLLVAGLVGSGSFTLTHYRLVYRWRSPRAPMTPLTQRSAGLFAVGMTLALVVAAAMNVGSQLLLLQLAPISEFGHATMMSNMAAGITAVLMPLALFVVMLTRSHHAQERGGVES